MIGFNFINITQNQHLSRNAVIGNINRKLYNCILLSNIEGSDRIKRNFYSPIKPMKNIWINEHHDSDWDGVPNFRDCRPFNPRRQHVRPSKTMRKRLEDIPLYVTDEPIHGGEEYDVSHILEAKKEAPKAQRELYATIKKYPSVVGEMERQRPKDMLYSSVPGTSFAKEGLVIARAPQTIRRIKEQKKMLKKHKTPEDERELYERAWSEFPHRKESMSAQEKKKTGARAMIFLHELHHLQQQKGLEKKLSKEEYEKHEEKEKEYHDKLRLSPHERGAVKYSVKKLEERREKGKRPTGEEISETLDLE